MEVLNVIYFASNQNTGVVRNLRGVHHDGNGYSSVTPQSAEQLVTEVSAITVQIWPLRPRCCLTPVVRASQVHGGLPVHLSLVASRLVFRKRVS